MVQSEKIKRNNTHFKKWVQDDDRDEIERILQLKKQDSSEDVFHKKLFKKFQRQFT